MKSKSLKLATAVALGLLSTTAFSATMMANNSNKGSLLVFPRIDVRPGVDTIVAITNDASVGVQVKCYYRTSEPVPTPLSSKTDVSFIKHTMDFSFPLTRNQTVAWSAATGQQLGTGLANIPGTGNKMIAQAFGLFPDGSTRPTGELKCFAVGSDGAGNVGQINFNQLFGTATVVTQAGQAYEYNAWAFQALGGTAAQGQLVGTSGTLNLDGNPTGYDLCPNILLANFQVPGNPLPPTLGNGVQMPAANPPVISIVACNQDLTQRSRPFITKYTYTFWNQDEFARTGTHECGDSYYEQYFQATGLTNGPLSPFNPNSGAPVSDSTVVAPPTAPTNTAPGRPGGVSIIGMPLAQYSSLGTAYAYMRVESVADTFICAGAVHFGMLGVISQDNGNGGNPVFQPGTTNAQGVFVPSGPAQPGSNLGVSGTFLRGTNMIGRGTFGGQITYDAGPADSFKK